ncbi:MAG TPA: MFS transporter, partial [Verrucomicrobiae bacterium]|nr:MFS transporter [Verrucomicrobiae bacterium]
MLPHHVHYFSKHLNPEVKEVYWFAGINSLALTLSFIFEPIYLYQLGYSLVNIMWFYFQVYVWFSVLIFLGAKVASRVGYKHSMLIGSIMYILYWTALYNIKSIPELFFVAPLFFALQKSFFWPAYDAEVALASKRVQRGRELGALMSVVEIIAIVGPFFGGLISLTLGFGALFLTSGTLLLIAVYPLFKSPEVYTEHNFEFKNFQQVIKKHWRNFWGYWGMAEDLILTNLWPLYIFLTIPHFLGVGSVATFAGLTSAMLMLYIGKVTDKSNKQTLIRKVSFFYG